MQTSFLVVRIERNDKRSHLETERLLVSPSRLLKFLLHYDEYTYLFDIHFVFRRILKLSNSSESSNYVSFYDEA